MNIYETLAVEYAQILRQIERVGQTPPDEPGRRVRKLESVARRIAALDAFRERHLYPLLTADPRTSDSVATSRRQCGQIDALLEELRRTPATEPSFLQCLGQLHSTVRQHFEREENIFFPRAAEVIPADHAEELGRELVGRLRASA
jgi:hypothetical protein